MDENQKAGITDTVGVSVEIPAANYAHISNDGSISIGSFQGKDNVLLWNDGSKGKVEYKVDIPTDGNYNLVFEYSPLTDETNAIERGLEINNEVQYNEAGSFRLDRHFKYDQYPFVVDSMKNQVRPKQLAVKDWFTQPVSDKTAMISEPLRFFFNKGVNTITLKGVNGAVAISRIIVKSPEVLPTYQEYKNSLPSTNNAKHFLYPLEAENVYQLSTKSITLNSVSEAGVTPETYGYITYNTIGGDKWKNANEWVEWQFEVPEDGIYNIALKYKQNVTTNTGLTTYRQIMIDGKVPFQEMENVAFNYTGSWKNKVLGDSNPYGFYLTKGKHTIRLTVKSEPYCDIYDNMMSVADEILKLDYKVKEVTGVTSSDQVDMYRFYNLDKYIPDLSSNLKKIAKELEDQLVTLTKLTGSSMGNFGTLQTDYENLLKYAADLNLITKAFDTLTKIQQDIVTYASYLQQQPLLLDRILIKSADATFTSASPNFFHILAFYIKQLLMSFTINNDNTMGNVKKDEIQVWVQRNRDYVNLMQQMANQGFTQKTGLKVNINYIPSQDVLVLANAAGKQPDIATGVGRDVPFNFALRGAIIPMNDFPGYKELRDNVTPGSLIAYHYDGKDYGLPEQCTFNMLFYRSDILEQNNIKVPQTWDEVKSLVATLQQNKMNFWLIWGDWMTFFYQNNVNPYSSDGLSVGFNNADGFRIFKMWSELYTKYNFPQRIGNFYNSFRTGEIPIGISGITDFMQLTLAAPELSGRWKMAPIPGTYDSSGRLIRWQSGGQDGIMMMKTNPERQNRAWKFIQWWLSTDTQIQFANDLESYCGIEFRWYSANPEVVKNTPWDPDTKKAVLEQLAWFKGIPYAPGGSYILEREMQNALSAVVIDKKNYRQTLELQIQAIEREMKRTQQEFGLIDANGKVLHKLDMYDIPLPNMEASQ